MPSLNIQIILHILTQTLTVSTFHISHYLTFLSRWVVPRNRFITPDKSNLVAPQHSSFHSTIAKIVTHGWSNEVPAQVCSRGWHTTKSYQISFVFVNQLTRELIYILYILCLYLSTLYVSYIVISSIFQELTDKERKARRKVISDAV